MVSHHIRLHKYWWQILATTRKFGPFANLKKISSSPSQRPNWIKIIILRWTDFWRWIVHLTDGFRRQTGGRPDKCTKSVCGGLVRTDALLLILRISWRVRLLKWIHLIQHLQTFALVYTVLIIWLTIRPLISDRWFSTVDFWRPWIPNPLTL